MSDEKMVEEMKMPAGFEGLDFVIQMKDVTEEERYKMIDKKLADPEYILNFIRVGLELPEEEPGYMTRTSAFDGLDEFLYIEACDKIFRLELKEKTLMGLSEEDLWNAARKNVNDTAVIIEGSKAGWNIGTANEKFWIISAEDICGFGAAAIGNKNAIRRLFKEVGAEKALISPATADGFIFIPTDGSNKDKERIKGIVSHIKKNLPKAKSLGDVVYQIKASEF